MPGERNESARRLARQLLARIHRRYQTVTEPITLGGQTLNFTRIANANRVLEEVAAAEDSAEAQTGLRKEGDALRLPYWAELWDSASGVGEWLLRSNLVNADTDALDLGCGMGLTGCLMAAAGAKVMFADLESSALLFARLNSLHSPRRTRCRALNWRTDQLHQRFNLIVGADILYETGQWPHLERFFREHLAEAGVVILGEPHRPGGDRFAQWIQDRRWRLFQFSTPLPASPEKKPIRIFRLESPR